MTGAHRQIDSEPAGSALENVGCVLGLVGFLAAIGFFAYFLATDSNDVWIPLIALQGWIGITYATRVVVKVLRNRSPSPVATAELISDSAHVIMWTVIPGHDDRRLRGVDARRLQVRRR
jgi:hypothetical protein